MISNFLKTLALATFAPAFALGLASCSSGVKGQDTTTVIANDTSAEVIDTFQMQATISAVNPSKRMITLSDSSGNKTNVKAGPGVGNLGAFKVGDRVMATITEDYVASLRQRNAPPSAAEGQMVGLATANGESATLQAATFQQTAEVVNVDTQNRKVTLLLVDGKTKTFKVNRNVDLGNVHVGDDLTVRVAESIAITIVPS
jgi:hypothetical protein